MSAPRKRSGPLMTAELGMTRKSCQTLNEVQAFIRGYRERHRVLKFTVDRSWLGGKYDVTIIYVPVRKYGLVREGAIYG